MLPDALVAVGAVAGLPVPARLLPASLVQVLTLVPFPALGRGSVERTHLPLPGLAVAWRITGSGAGARVVAGAGVVNGRSGMRVRRLVMKVVTVLLGLMSRGSRFQTAMWCYSSVGRSPSRFRRSRRLVQMLLRLIDRFPLLWNVL